jgi:Zn-dependent protease
MDRMTLVDGLVLMVAGTIVVPLVVPLVVLIHEAGHAIAALVLRRRVAELTVGDDDPLLTMRVGRFRVRLGAITGRGDVAGFVRYDGLGADARSTFVIALAGPMASLAGAVLTGVLAAWSWPHADQHPDHNEDGHEQNKGCDLNSLARGRAVVVLGCGGEAAPQK